MNKKIIYSIFSLIVLFGLAQTHLVFADYGIQTKTSGCTANQILPDSSCTPGAVLTTDVSVICKSGYTKTVRDVSTATKKKVFVEYGILWSQHSNYEVDHLISLEIGGGNDISNLWPENSKITGGSLTKDKFENYLHDQVCSNKITVQEAQKEISSNWLKYYQEYLSSGTTPKKTTQVANTNATTTSASVPAGATGKCNDGTYTYSVTHRGACSKHGGVSKWY